MSNKLLFDAQKDAHYIIVGFVDSTVFNHKPFNNIGLYIGKQFYLQDVRYNRKMFFITVDKVQYAIRGTDTKYIYIRENN